MALAGFDKKWYFPMSLGISSGRQAFTKLNMQLIVDDLLDGIS